MARRTTPPTEPSSSARQRPGRPLGFDQDAAVAALTEAFWEHGWAAASTPVLEAATGLSRSSLTNTFHTKQRMLELALGHYNELIANELITDLDNPRADPAAALHGFFDTLAHLKTAGPGKHGCLMVNTMIELPNATGPIRKQTRRYERLLIDAFTAALDRLQNGPGNETPQRAHALLALAIAINLHARNHDRTALNATIAAAHDLLAGWGI
ncbi:MAG: hypothetical protein RL238_3101 [Actinomycetota bacterium]